MSGETAAVHPAAVVNPLADMGAPLEAELEVCAELGGARYGLSLKKLASWDGPVNSLADRIAYVHHSRLFTLDDESAWPAERAALSRTLQLAHEVRAPSILAVTGPAGSLRTWEQALTAFTAAYQPLADRAAALGVRVCVEQTNVLRQDVSFVSTIPDLVQLAETSGVSVCLDMFWSWRERALSASLRACGPYVGLVQLADAVPTSVSMPDRVVPGDGVVPLGWLVEQVAATGYRGYFDVELLGPRIDAEGARQAVIRGLRRVSDLLYRSYPAEQPAGRKEL
jgi:sugar phosphate isomerase/epimerase